MGIFHHRKNQFGNSFLFPKEIAQTPRKVNEANIQRVAIKKVQKIIFDALHKLFNEIYATGIYPDH